MEFKLIEREKIKKYNGDLAKMRRDAHVISTNDKRVFSIDISKYEYCGGKTEAYVGDYVVFAYTLSMIAIEKLRAICQQMPEYTLRAHPRARARDFYDIHAIVASGRANLLAPENRRLLEQVFAAKDVPLSLLARIATQQFFHETDWPSVRDSLRKKPRDFAFYFNFVVELAQQLEVNGDM